MKLGIGKTYHLIAKTNFDRTSQYTATIIAYEEPFWKFKDARGKMVWVNEKNIIRIEPSSTIKCQNGSHLFEKIGEAITDGKQLQYIMRCKYCAHETITPITRVRL